MTTGAKNSMGNLFKAVAAGGSLATIGELLTINWPNLQRGMQDATTLDQASQAMEFIPEGVYDPDAVTLTYHHIDQNASDAFFYGALVAGTLLDIQCTAKKASGTGTLSGQGYVTSYNPQQQQVKGKQVAQVTIKATGAWTRA